MPLDSVPPPRLRFAWLEITNRCNLNCRHCYAESGPHEPAVGRLELNDWYGIMDQLRAVGCDAVQFIGGEPTLHPHFGELVAYADQAGFQSIEVYTNATRLSPRVCALLAKYRVQVAVSFYSTDPRVHDAITGRIGSFERTVSGIREAVHHGLVTRVGLIAMDENRGNVEAARKFVLELGVASASVDRERGFGRAVNHSGRTASLEELCGACGSERVAINANGEVSPCVFSHFRPIGSTSDGLPQLLTTGRLDQFRQELSLAKPDVCSPSCEPHECRPSSDDGPCFPSGCDPRMCNPDSCAPKD